MYGNLPGDKYRSRDMELAQQLIAQSENNGTITSGLASILKKGMAGFLMGEDKKKSDAYNQALSTGLATPYSPAMEAQSAVPYSDFNTGEFEADEGLNIDMEFSGDGSNPEILKSLPEGGNLLEARDAQPADGPMRGAQRSLRALLATGRPNEYAQSALLPLTMAQAGQDRAAQLAKTARENQLLDATTLFDRQSKRKEMDVENAQNKFNKITVIADKNSKTGYSRVLINPLGQKRLIGDAPKPPSDMYMPFSPPPAQTKTNPNQNEKPTSKYRLGRFGVPTSNNDPFAGLDRKTVNTMITQERSKLTSSVQKRLADLRVQDKMLSRLNRFKSLMDGGMGTGVEKSGFLGTAQAAFDEKLKEAQAIQNEITPQMRQGLPGAASDRDVAMFAGATVSIDKPEKTNYNIIKAKQIQIDNAKQKLEFEQDYYTQNRHIIGMEAAWKDYIEANPIFDPDKAIDDSKFTLNPNRKGYKEWFADPVALRKKQKNELPPVPEGFN